MNVPHLLLSIPVTAPGVAALRGQVREVAELSGLEGLQQTRFATAVSEIADAGPGIADPARAMQGFVLPTGRTSMGIPGSGRLVDRLAIEARPHGGTLVRLEVDLPRGAPELTQSALTQIALRLGKGKVHSPLEEVEQQNRELLRIHQQLRDKQAALELADERKNRFVTTLAHELRNPLATLELTLAVLRLKPEVDKAELLKRCDIMGRQTAQLTKLVEDLIDVARVSQGKVELRKERTELNDIVLRAVEMSSAAIQAKGHEVIVTAAPSPVWVMGDPPRLTQVLGNLLQNAARYTPDSGMIEVKVREVRGQATVDVIDNGIGIAPELIPHVFELFVQGDANPLTGSHGLGIGLTLVRHLVADHGGSVQVTSRGSHLGSTFSVTLPVSA